ncbi:hypothetical protein [uncultured Clostridium sp.]|uniref:hypothetical protein n=1 Tax=uncultured Clostridium sp. TaxID=59620 RepID=UPI00262FEA39|nr:hypothetical protein [uncultured Clostridium sp.]
MSNIKVINNKTKQEYIVMYVRGDNVVLSRSCSMGYVNLTRKELEDNYTFEENYAKEDDKGGKIKFSNISDDIDKLSKKIYKLSKDLEDYKATESPDVIKCKKLEKQLKQVCNDMNHKVMELVNK